MPVYHKVPADTEDLDVPEQEFERIIVAPYFHRAEINEFTEALTTADKAIEVIDADRIFQLAFPDQVSSIEVAVSSLLKPDVSDRIRSSGIRFFVVLSPYETSRTEGDATFIGVGFHGTSIVSTNLIAGLVDLDNPESYEHLET